MMVASDREIISNRAEASLECLGGRHGWVECGRKRKRETNGKPDWERIGLEGGEDTAGLAMVDLRCQ